MYMVQFYVYIIYDRLLWIGTNNFYSGDNILLGLLASARSNWVQPLGVM